MGHLFFPLSLLVGKQSATFLSSAPEERRGATTHSLSPLHHTLPLSCAVCLLHFPATLAFQPFSILNRIPSPPRICPKDEEPGHITPRAPYVAFSLPFVLLLCSLWSHCWRSLRGFCRLRNAGYRSNTSSLTLWPTNHLVATQPIVSPLENICYHPSQYRHAPKPSVICPYDHGRNAFLRIARSEPRLPGFGPTPTTKRPNTDRSRQHR